MNIKTRLAAAAIALGALMAAAMSVDATNGQPINPHSRAKYTLAIIGDNPYGADKVTDFPGFINFINEDDKVDLVAHVGDIKSGSTLCTDTYLTWVRDELERLLDPVVYTPGDNEWTDCHRANNGNYKPTERLAKLRELYFPTAGETLGDRQKRVLSQAGDPAHGDYVENVLWMESRVVFATLNVPGSNNDTVLWTGLWTGNAEQAAEVGARNAANLAWLAEAFETADEYEALGVVLMFQADMWDAPGTATTLNGYHQLVNAIGYAAIDFEKPVLMLVGDSHEYVLDNPYDGSAFFQTRHPTQPIAHNVTRVIVEGSPVPAERFQYVRLTVDPKSEQLFTIERVDYYPD